MLEKPAKKRVFHYESNYGGRFLDHQRQKFSFFASSAYDAFVFTLLSHVQNNCFLDLFNTFCSSLKHGSLMFGFQFQLYLKFTQF